MGYLLQQSSASRPLLFLLLSSSDGKTGLTGKAGTLSVKLSKAGAAGVTPSGAVSEVDATHHPGWYAVAGNATDTSTLGPLLLTASCRREPTRATTASTWWPSIRTIR